MPKRNSINSKKVMTLRRSPRFLYQKNTPQNSKIPKPTSRKNQVCPSLFSSAEKTLSDFPLSSIENVSLKKTHEKSPRKITMKSVRLISGLKKSAKSINGSRKSARLVNGVEEFRSLRRSPRFPNPRIASEHVVRPISTESSDIEVSSEVTPKGDLEKKQTRSRRVIGSDKIVGKAELGIDSYEEFARTTEGERRIGVKRKWKPIEECCSLQGWTKDQEMALQRAYFAAKPSPHFWKKVSKLVPGKSAQECFDKVHSDLVTPPQPRPHSRANRTNSSPPRHFSLSASKLLEPTKPDIKRPSYFKQKSRVAQKTARHLLQKHYLVDQGYEADLFSVLEPTTNPATQASQQTKILSTPKCVLEETVFPQKYHEKSSSAQKKSLSRFGNSCQTNLLSPPVLKQVKNMALHEKYIDKLHCRETRRKAAYVRASKCITEKEDRKENHVQKMDVVKAARNALVFDARDVINQFQHLQANAMNNSDDFDDVGVDGDNDEGEDGN